MSVAWVGAGIAALGVGSQVAAAEKAEDAQVAASRRASQTTEGQAAIAREDLAPWRRAGEAGLNQLSNLLGLPAQAKEQEEIGLVDMSSGIPMPNNDLYASSPEYRAAWDAGLRFHEQQYGQGYTTESSPSSIDAAIRKRIDPSIYTAKAQAPSAAPDADFGALNREFTNADFVRDPGYEFRLGEGMKGLERSAAARGGLLSGAALKAASRYNQDFASNEFGNSANRFNVNQANRFNRLASIAGIGQTAATQTGQNAMTVGQQVAQNQLGVGNVRASGYVGQANALTGALGQGYNMYQDQQMMDMLRKQNQGGGVNSAGGSYSQDWIA